MNGGDLADPNSAPIGFLLNEGPEARAAARRFSEYWMLPPPLLSFFQSLPHSQGINSRKLIILPRAL